MATHVQLSIVVPAYNEASRIEPTLEELFYYLTRRSNTFEVIVVDDGSRDATADICLRWGEQHPQLRVVSLEQNSGKGAAVRRGVEEAQGDFILFCDADGATPIAELARLEAALYASTSLALAIGSRAAPSKETLVTTSIFRKLPGRLFNFVVNLLLVRNVRDTQCGFKLFPKDIAKQLFAQATATGWVFDVEILFLAQRAGIRILEVPVNWTNIPGSKVNVLRDGLIMVAQLFQLRLRHLLR